MSMIATHADVMKCRDAFWEKVKGKITQRQLETITDEINNGQIELPIQRELTKELERIGGYDEQNNNNVHEKF